MQQIQTNRHIDVLHHFLFYNLVHVLKHFDLHHNFHPHLPIHLYPYINAWICTFTLGLRHLLPFPPAHPDLPECIYVYKYVCACMSAFRPLLPPLPSAPPDFFFVDIYSYIYVRIYVYGYIHLYCIGSSLHMYASISASTSIHTSRFNCIDKCHI